MTPNRTMSWARERFLARDAGGFQRARQQLAGRPDEGMSLEVFLVAWLFADALRRDRIHKALKALPDVARALGRPA